MKLPTPFALGLESDKFAHQIINAKGQHVARVECDPLKEYSNLFIAAPDLLNALELVSAFLKDLSKSNPGFMGKLVLQDYELYNTAMLAMPKAIAKAKGK